MHRIKHIAGNYELYLFLLPAVIVFIVFDYLPMYGVQIAFKDFFIKQGILGSPWVGLKHFFRFFNGAMFLPTIKNTVGISVYSLLVGFPAPILLALLINEIPSKGFKKIVQTVSYAPHFISTVVMVGMLMLFLNANNGIVNRIISIFGFKPIGFMSSEGWFKTVYVFSGIWQSVGWGSIIYLSALSGVDPELHQAAMIDGAGRLQRIRHINIPWILPTAAILFILNTGRLMSVGFEKVYLMQNPLNLGSSEIIATYVYKMGILSYQYSFSAAVGLFNSMVNFVLLLMVNYVVKRLSSAGLF